MDKNIGIFVCEYFFREATVVIAAEKYDDVTVISLPANCIDRKGRSPECRDFAARREAGLSHSLFIGSDCFRDLKGASGDADPETRHVPDQCFELFIGSETLAHYQRQGRYVLTPGWLSRWRRNLDRWGFDQSTAREFFGESCKGLLMLDTGIDPGSGETLRRFAEYVGLKFEIVPVGLDHFRQVISGMVLQCRLEDQRALNRELSAAANRETAHYAMIFDMVSRLESVTDENSAIEEILNVLITLFSPGEALFAVKYADGTGRVLTGRDGTFSWSRGFSQDFRDGAYGMSEDGKGFTVAVSHHGSDMGYIQVKNVLFPEYRDRYLNIGLLAAQVAGLVIENARGYQQMNESLEVKNALMRELHHRMKNNFQMIMALVSLQSKNIANPESQALFDDLSNRIKAMALVHEKLYQSSEISRVDLAGYIRSISDRLYGAYAHSMPRPALNLDVENVMVGTDEAVSCGLLINEILTNAFKYAFPAGFGDGAVISISLRKMEPDLVILDIRDNGRGIPGDVGLDRTPSLGLTLIPLLVQQLHGTITLEREAGTRFLISFSAGEQP